MEIWRAYAHPGKVAAINPLKIEFLNHLKKFKRRCSLPAAISS
jgi:hypothetical protein